MRPIRLILGGWGPYAGIQEIDFSGLESGSMFLITGPTGSGKTTIFDAVTYAIYGMVSGRTRDKNSVRSDFASEETDTFVELVFTHKGKNIAIRRTPKYDRKKKRGEGFITRNETAELTIDDQPPLTVVKDVNQRLIELMGFSYEQYKQTAMIAQGEFMELLLTSSRERVEIFRNLFKTAAYEQIQRTLTEKTKQQYQEIQAIRQRMEEARTMVDAGEEPELSELVKAEYPAYDKLLAALSLHISACQADIRELEKQLSDEEKLLAKQKQKGQAYFELSSRLEKLTGEQEQQAKKVQVGEEQYQKTLNKKEEQEQKIEQETAQLRQSLEALQSEKQEKQQQLAAYETLETEEGVLNVSLEQIKNEIEEFQRLLVKRQAVEQQKQKLEEEQASYIAEEKICRQIRRTYEEKEESYKAAAIGIAARLLEEGKPCPVCGSTEHPKVAKLAQEVPDEKEVKEWKQKWEAAEKKLEQCYQKATREKGVLEAMEAELKEFFAKLSVAEESLEPAYQVVLAREKETRQEKQLLQNKKREKEKLKKEVSAAEKKLEEKKQRWENRRDQVERQRLSLQEDINKKKTEWEKQKAVYAQREKERLELCREEQRLRAKVDIEGLKEEIERHEMQKKELQKEREKKLARLGINKSAQKSMEEKFRALQKKEEVHAVYRNLEMVTKGNNKDRVVFEHYVLAAYFEDVLQAANIRLASMSGGRYELMKVKKVMDARTTDSLELEVLDNYTGKARSVKTLSGGEAFKAALSMALGLSDIVQSNAGGIQVETLFIDEGFGSLDEESLDQALESLIKLSGHNQTIGIISHVNELKERMEKQVVVEKGKSGSRILPLF